MQKIQQVDERKFDLVISLKNDNFAQKIVLDPIIGH